MNTLLEPFTHAFLQRAFVAVVLVGLVCAATGTYAVQRRMAFLGDGLAHALLPGLVLAAIYEWNVLASAVVAGVVAALVIAWMGRGGRTSEDSAIGIAFTALFALGVLLMSATGSFRDFHAFLFGNLLGLPAGTVTGLAVLAALVLGTLLALHKELELSTYDRAYARQIGARPEVLRGILLVLLALTIVGAVQAVGVLLTSALLITPAAAASRLGSRLPVVMAVAAVLALLSGVGGLYAAYFADLAPAPLIVLFATGLYVAVSVLRRA